jgi:8-hydroxy-5-deazaflavin:NADPH oxidoreductase
VTHPPQPTWAGATARPISSQDVEPLTRVGIIGAGNIGGNIARRLALAGHPVIVSFARDQARLAALAAAVGGAAGEPSDAAAAEVVVLSVPWGLIDEALRAAGPLGGRIVIDTTNQFGRAGVLDLGGRTAARVNADRMPGARYTKSFNTLTAAFQEAAASRAGPERVVQWIAGDDEAAKTAVASLITGAGYLPVDLAAIDDCAVMEAPRRAGAVYGEEYRAADAAAVVAAVRAGLPIPPPPGY